MPGILSSLPDLSATAQLSVSAKSGLGSLLGLLDGGIASDKTGSPLATLASAMQGLQAKLNVDVSGLTRDFPATLTTVRNAVPPTALDFVDSLQAGYAGASGLLGNLAVVKQIPAGGNLQDTALAVIGAALDEFSSRQASLAQNLIDPAKLKTVADTIASFDRFRTAFAANQGDFVAFLAQNLVGVSNDLLNTPLTHVQAIFAAFAQLDAAALAKSIGAQRTDLANAVQALLAAVNAFNPSDANTYAAVQSALGGVQHATQALQSVVAPLYSGLQSAFDGLAWDQLFARLASLLSAIAVPAVPTLADGVASLRDTLEELLARVRAMSNSANIAARIGALAALIRTEFTSSPIGQLRKAMADFLGRIRHAIEGIPTDEVQSTVTAMLSRVDAEVGALHLDAIGGRITQALSDVQTYVAGTITDTLRDQIGKAMQALADNLKSLPIDRILTDVKDAIAQVQSAIATLEQSGQAAVSDLNGLISQMDGLSFQPVSDEVIAKIGEITTKLQTINPDALSDVEKLALKAAFTVLQQIDLEGKIIAGLKQGFQTAGSGVGSLLDELAVVLARLKAALDQYDPKQLVGAITGLLDQVAAAVNQVNATTLFAPLYAQVGHLTDGLTSIAPGALLDPLKAPYSAATSAVDGLDPARWLAPLNAAYGEIDTLIGYIDVTSLMQELDRRQSALLATARDSLLAAVDNLHLPDPLSGFATTLRPFVQAITDALFGAPDQAIPQIAGTVNAHLRPSTLFAPLDELFDQLTQMAAAVPEQAMTDGANALRSALGAGLDAVDPRSVTDRLRAYQGALEGLAPGTLFAFTSTLPSLRASFALKAQAADAAHQNDVTAALASFDVTIGLTASTDAGALIPLLQQAFETLQDSLRSRMATLDTSGAEAAYGTLRANLDKLLPDFLRSPNALSYHDVLTGIEALRPSSQAAPLDDLFNQFLAELAPMENDLQPAVTGFLQSLRDVVQMVNPLSLRDALGDVYAAIHDKVRVLDPAALAPPLTAAFAPVKSAIGALDPEALKAQLDAAYQGVVTAITTSVRGVLDEIKAVVDDNLAAIRTAVTGLVQLVATAISTLVQGLQDVLERVEHLVFVDLLDHLRKTLTNLEASFNKELDRVRTAFDAMIAAIPLGGGVPSPASVGL